MAADKETEDKKSLHDRHFQRLRHEDPWVEPIYPQSPGGNERTSACGDSGDVFNASLLGGMGMQLLSGSGHIQYRGITPGSSEEMKNSRLFSVSLWKHHL